MLKRKLEECKQKIQDKKNKIIHLEHEVAEIHKRKDSLRSEIDQEEANLSILEANNSYLQELYEFSLIISEFITVEDLNTIIYDYAIIEQLKLKYYYNFSTSFTNFQITTESIIVTDHFLIDNIIDLQNAWLAIYKLTPFRQLKFNTEIIYSTSPELKYLKIINETNLKEKHYNEYDVIFKLNSSNPKELIYLYINKNRIKQYGKCYGKFPKFTYDIL